MDMEKGNRQDKGKYHADATSYELLSRSTSPPPTASAVASSSSHQDNNLNQRSSLDFRFSSFSAYLGRALPTNGRIIGMGRGDHQDKGKSHADDTSYELSSRSTSPPPTTPPAALSSSHQDNNINQRSSLGFRFSSFSAYLGRIASPNKSFSAYLGRVVSLNPFSAYQGRVVNQFKQRTVDIEEGCPHQDEGKSPTDAPVPASPQQGTSSLQDKGKSRADSSVSQPISRSDTSYETSFLPITLPIALSSSHQDNNLNQQSSLGFLFSSFSAYLGRVASPSPLSAYLGRVASPNPFSAYLGRVTSQFKQRTIDIEKGWPHWDKGKSRADPPVPASSQHGTSSLSHKDKGKSRAVDSSVSQPILSSDAPYETSSVVIRSTSMAPIFQGQPIASSSSRKLEDIPTQPVETFDTSIPTEFLNRIKIRLGTTRWRVINTFFLLIAGTAKSISAYKNASAPVNSLDLVIGIVWALISYWLSIFENEDPNMIPWLFQPTQLDMWKLAAPILLPCCFVLIPFLMFKFMFLSLYLTQRVEERVDTGFPTIILVIFMMIGTALFLVIWVVPVVVHTGFKFLPVVYAKLSLIIKAIFHSGDWEISLETLPFFGVFILFLWLQFPVILASVSLPTPLDKDLMDPSFQVGASMAFGLTFFPMYFVLGFGRMGIRLAKWVYNRNKTQIKHILSFLSSTLAYLKIR